jgi:DeoR/GlpR family transcriptional regulator of sugar metabolism
MIENSDEVFLLADSSKIEKNSFAIFAPVSAVDYIITDQHVDPSLLPKYEKHNVKLFCNDLKSAGKAAVIKKRGKFAAS